MKYDKINIGGGLMSSIAYITDKNMLEFHRINGNKKLNFWRPSATTKFSDFKNGDLLFFLAKGTKKDETSKEKGIVGYGRFVDGELLTPKIAWNRYEKLNGYNSKDEFYEAIIKFSKKEALPDNIGCLFLDNVVFFQSPIYLSEIGISVSNRLESYFYLEKEAEDATYLILEKAKEVGIDIWSLSFDDGESQESFELANKIEMIKKVHRFISDSYSEKELKQINEFSLLALHQLEEDLDIDFIKGSRTDLYYIEKNEINILVPTIEYSSVSKQQAIVRSIGKLLSYKALLDFYNNDYKIRLKALLEWNIEEGLIMWIESCGIETILIKDKI